MLAYTRRILVVAAYVTLAVLLFATGYGGLAVLVGFWAVRALDYVQPQTDSDEVEFWAVVEGFESNA